MLISGVIQQEESSKALRSLEQLSEQRQVELRERIKNLQAQHCQAIDFLQAQLVESRAEVERLSRQIDEIRVVKSKTAATEMTTNSSERTMSPSNSGIISSPNGLNSSSSSAQFRTGLIVRVDDSNDVNIYILKFCLNYIFKNISTENKDVLSQNVLNNSNGGGNETSTNGILSAKTIKTFEQLLNEELSAPNITPNHINNDLTLTQIEKLKVDLSKSRVQLEHLNELLNESELNNNRLSDQISLLKEEIRRFGGVLLIKVI